jgi:hypothetical protein
VAPPDPSRPVYTEGALRYIRLAGPAPPIEKQLDPESPMQIRLTTAGDYQLSSWARVCNGTCGNLSDPTDRCEASLTAVAGGTVSVRIDAPVGKDCSISIGG